MSTSIKQQRGNLFSVKQGHIVHGCNAQGVMGSGVALGVKNLYPGAYESYRIIHETQGLVLGQAYPWQASTDLLIWNAITQHGFGSGRRYVSYDAIQTCFEEINRIALDRRDEIAPHIHIPLIGAGRAGGNWDIISAIIENTVDVSVTLWLPDETVDTI